MQPLGELGWADSQGIGTKRPPGRKLISAGEQPEPSEASRIAKNESGAIVEPPCRVDVIRGQSAARSSPEHLTAHPEMDPQCPPVGADHRHELAAAVDSLQGAPFEQLGRGEPRRTNTGALAGEPTRWIARAHGDVASMERCPDHRSAHQVRDQRASQVFDLGQFGHAIRVSSANAGPEADQRCMLASREPARIYKGTP